MSWERAPRVLFIPAALMNRILLLGIVVCGLATILSSCVEPERQVVGPTTETSKIPWNRPIAGQGQGQMGMLPQNQYRR